MDYNKIKKEITNKYRSVKIFFEKYPEILTEGGFYQSIEGNSMKIKKLEEISEKLELPMTYWFQEEQPLVTGEEKINYGIAENERELLMRQIKENLDCIDELREKAKVYEPKKKANG